MHREDFAPWEEMKRDGNGTISTRTTPPICREKIN